jgi:hypothetical protein
VAKTALLGEQYDDALFQAVGRALQTMGASCSANSGAAGESQDIGSWTFAIGPDELLLEAETYKGLSVSGSPELVDKLVTLLS